MSKSITSVVVYFQGDAARHSAHEFRGANEYVIELNTGALRVLSDGKNVAVFPAGEWKQARTIRTCDSCGK